MILGIFLKCGPRRHFFLKKSAIVLIWVWDPWIIEVHCFFVWFFNLSTILSLISASCVFMNWNNNIILDEYCNLVWRKIIQILNIASSARMFLMKACHPEKMISFHNCKGLSEYFTTWKFCFRKKNLNLLMVTCYDGRNSHWFRRLYSSGNSIFKWDVSMYHKPPLIPF